MTIVDSASTDPRARMGRYARDLWRLVASSWMNALCVVVVPAAIVHATRGEGGAMWTLITSSVAVIGLASLISSGVDGLCTVLNQAWCGVAVAVFGNVVELMVGLISAAKGNLGLAQVTMVGSIVNNQLLVLGSCIVLGCARKFSSHGVASGLQAFATLMVIPIVCYGGASAVGAKFPAVSADGLQHGLTIAMSVLLVGTYLQGTVFKYTHKEQYDANDPRYCPRPMRYGESVSRAHTMDEDTKDAPVNVASSLTLLLVATVATYFAADALVASVVFVASKSPHVSQDFVAFILIPVLANVPEHYTAIVAGKRNRMTQGAVGSLESAFQVAALVFPLTCLASFASKHVLTLALDPVYVGFLIASSFTCLLVTLDNSVNWLEGAVMITLYVVMGMIAYVWQIPSAV